MSNASVDYEQYAEQYEAGIVRQAGTATLYREDGGYKFEDPDTGDYETWGDEDQAIAGFWRHVNQEDV